ncbi:MAG: DegV family EDD domain-containing protein [Actinomycetota bacterium]|nr:DegV family EDD domain-containing protein [Actinomycetota bacterium]
MVASRGQQNRVALITDSSACLPPDLTDRLGLRVLPIAIHLPSGDIHDGVPRAPQLVYEALAAGDPVKSSAPATVEYLSAIEEADAPSVVVITPAIEFTVMYRNAVLAAEVAGRSVSVVDSRAAAAAHGLVVMAAAQVAADGGSEAEVVRAAEDASRRAELVGVLDSLEFIRRSGRVPSVALELAERLGVRPVFRLDGGRVERLGVPRSSEAALRRVRREATLRGLSATSPSMVFHAASPARAEELRAALGGDPMVVEFSPSMGIHTGPGVVGVAWLRDRPNAPEL